MLIERDATKWHYAIRPGGIWAIGCLLQGSIRPLVQDRPLDCTWYAETILLALGIVPTEEMLNRYFPRKFKKERCPTLELLNMTIALNPHHPENTKTTKGMVGV
jgi:hypothetical protein